MLNREEFNFGRMRRALLAGVLGLGLGAVSVVGVTDTTSIGPAALLDSATDDGGGKIKIEWSLSEEEEGVTYSYSHPDELCVGWKEEGSSEARTDTCFTSEISTQSDLLVDTGIAEGTTANYDVILFTLYSNIRLYGEALQQAVVTVSGGLDPVDPAGPVDPDPLSGGTGP